MRKKKRRTGWIWFLLLVLGAGAFYKFYWLPKQAEAASGVSEYSEYTVTRGTVSVTVTGSGLLDAKQVQTETVIGGLKILTAEPEPGDVLREGDVLYTLDPDTVEERILAVTADLAEYKRTLSRYSDYDTVNAPGVGRVKIIYAKKGDLCADVLVANGCLAVLSADELMALDIDTAAAVLPGDEVQIVFATDNRTITERGSVEKLTDTGCTVILPDTNALPDVQATVKKGGEEIGTGVFYIHMPMYVYNTTGAIKSVDAKLNASVNTGSKLFTLAEDVAADSYRQTIREREEAAEELLELLRYRLDPVIRVKNAGVLAELPLRENEVTVKDASAAVMHTGGAVKMTVDIDETDIPGLKLGQPAEVTLDAYPNDPFLAEVTRMPAIGVQSGTITVYKVELTLRNDDRLLEGMHGSAVITLQTHPDVIMIPVTVLEEDAAGAYVLVSAAQGEEKRYVTTGISDGTWTEITEGLAEGDVILYIPRGGTDMVSKIVARNRRMMSGIGG